MGSGQPGDGRLQLALLGEEVGEEAFQGLARGDHQALASRNGH
jgi:hypothetical protein